MVDYFDLGSYSRAISTSSPEAQVWFDRALNWTFGFNHEEAIECYRKVLEHDPGCPMAHWGIAYCLGPNYNKPWELFDEHDLAQSLAGAYAATGQAVENIDHATPIEQALIEALQSRYQSGEPVALDQLESWNDAYADAMREVYQTFSDDLDIAAFFAEALLDRTPWQMWDIFAGQPAEGADTIEAKEVLERALEHPNGRFHPGVLHLYIHLMEMAPYPEQALRACDWLRDLVPDAGHLEHMPTHIDVQCGHYANVVRSNHAAVVADRKFVDRVGPMNFYAAYRSHNQHFKIWGAMFLANYEAAREAADELAASIPEEFLRVESPPMADWLEWFIPMPLHVMIRFGRWQEIIGQPMPGDTDLYCVTTTTLHYAKGVALAATGRIEEADAQRALFTAALARVPESRRMHNNVAIDVLAVADEMLAGELEYRRGSHDIAFAHLRRAIDLEDSLAYDEPWGWMQPVRHALGALLLEQGRTEEAEAVYRADLGLDDSLPRALQHRENVWALHGYHECLMRLGKHELATMIKQRLDLAMARADVPIHASCACRMEHHDMAADD